MKKIIEYATCIHNSYGTESLEKLVNEKIQEGFQPYGFPCASGATCEDADKHKQSDFFVLQAMVKYEN